MQVSSTYFMMQVCQRQTGTLKGKKSRDAYPDVLRRVPYVDLDTNKRFIFLTNSGESFMTSITLSSMCTPRICRAFRNLIYPLLYFSIHVGRILAIDRCFIAPFHCHVFINQFTCNIVILRDMLFVLIRLYGFCIISSLA